MQRMSARAVPTIASWSICGGGCAVFLYQPPGEYRATSR